METAWLVNVLQMVPSRLKKLEASIENLSDEMREDYLLSVKKAIGTLLSFLSLLSFFILLLPKKMLDTLYLKQLSSYYIDLQLEMPR